MGASSKSRPDQESGCPMESRVDKVVRGEEEGKNNNKKKETSFQNR